MKQSATFLCLSLAIAAGCARVAVEGGDKPIHIVMDVNIKIDQKLDQFFAYEDQPAPPATRTAATQNGDGSTSQTAGGNQ